MDIGSELVLFLIVAFIAVLAAAMMLLSENAVHSALFLILNFASVAFMYLMLNASFLAMVQVTVYAGAIMVLFLFVIMLLGAEKLLPESKPRFTWLTPLSAGLVIALLLVASIAILQSEVDNAEPKPPAPILRVVNANSQWGIVDVYVDNETLADDLEFGQGSALAESTEGEHTIRILAYDANAASASPLLEETVFLRGNDVIALVVLPQPIGESRLLRVGGSLDPVKERNTATLTIVHAVPCLVETACQYDLADNSDTSKNPVPLSKDLGYGEIAPTLTLRRDQYNNHNYTLSLYPAGALDTAIAAAQGETVQLNPLVSLRELEIKNNESLLWVITGDTRATSLRVRGVLLTDANRPTFGGGEGVGKLLFVDYMLPFEIIGVLLLVAMVGTIILTTQDTTPIRRRNVRRMAAVPGNPTVEEYVKAMKTGEALPAPTSTKQLPESTQGSGG